MGEWDSDGVSFRNVCCRMWQRYMTKLDSNIQKTFGIEDKENRTGNQEFRRIKEIVDGPTPSREEIESEMADVKGTDDFFKRRRRVTGLHGQHAIVPSDALDMIHGDKPVTPVLGVYLGWAFDRNVTVIHYAVTEKFDCEPSPKMAVTILWFSQYAKWPFTNRVGMDARLSTAKTLLESGSFQSVRSLADDTSFSHTAVHKALRYFREEAAVEYDGDVWRPTDRLDQFVEWYEADEKVAGPESPAAAAQLERQQVYSPNPTL